MADTSTTTYPIPSSNADVLEKNAENFDTYSNSTDTTYEDRGGIERKTLAGQQSQIDTFVSDAQTSIDTALDNFSDSATTALETFDANAASAVANAGYRIVGTFEDGGTIEYRSDVVHYLGDPDDSYRYQGFYVWLGTYPKTVTAGDAPDLTDPSNWQIAALGYTKQSGAIQLFGQTIDQDYTIPTGQNALCVAATTSEGVTVTIPENSILITIGGNE